MTKDIDFVFAIPSYQRAKKQATLDYFERIGVPSERIYMSVQTEADYNEYRAQGIEGRVARLIYREANCVAANRNTLLDSFPNGKMIVLIDDDVRSVVALNAEGKTDPVESYDGLRRIIVRGFSLAARFSTIAFGLYPTPNGYFMHNSIATRAVIDGQFFGVFNSPERFSLRYITKEDYEFGCRLIRRYGALIRLNMYSTNAGCRTKGGCYDVWKDETGRVGAAQMLCAEYPDIVRMNPHRHGEVLSVSPGTRKAAEL